MPAETPVPPAPPSTPWSTAAADIDAGQLSALLAAEVPLTLVDVREPWELEICALPGSVAMPMAQVPARFEEIPRDRMLVVVCHHGLRSAHAAAWFRRAGLGPVVNLIGGLDAWAVSIDPKMRRY